MIRITILIKLWQHLKDVNQTNFKYNQPKKVQALERAWFKDRNEFLDSVK